MGDPNAFCRTPLRLRNGHGQINTPIVIWGAPNWSWELRLASGVGDESVFALDGCSATRLGSVGARSEVKCVGALALIVSVENGVALVSPIDRELT